MKYLLLKKKFGTNKIEQACEVNVTLPVLDMCFCEDEILFLSGDHIGHIDIKTKKTLFPWLGKFNNPSSLCYRGKFCFIAENSGRDIKSLELSSKYIEDGLKGVATKKQIDLYFSKVSGNKNDETSIVIAEDETLYWTSGLINRCFRYKSGTLDVLIGNGRTGYALSNAPRNSIISNPSGVATYKDFVYVCDGNHCIRKVTDKEDCLVAGHPLSIGDKDGKIGISLLSQPTKIKSAQNIAYFIDCGKVKTLSFPDHVITTIAKMENVKAITTDQSNNLYALEEDIHEK